MRTKKLSTENSSKISSFNSETKNTRAIIRSKAGENYMQSFSESNQTRSLRQLSICGES